LHGGTIPLLFSGFFSWDENAGRYVIRHKNIVNLKLEISHIKNFEIAFGFLASTWS